MILPAAYVSSIKKRQSVDLTAEGEGSYWAGNITIGTPGQAFLIDFDSKYTLCSSYARRSHANVVLAGSSDLWVPSTNCTSSLCDGKDKYDASASSTSVEQDGSFAISYADKSAVAGSIWTETVSVGGITVQNQYFSPVHEISTQFAKELLDGILGLALPGLSALHQVRVSLLFSVTRAGLTDVVTGPIRNPCKGRGCHSKRHFRSQARAG